jgi:SulP family sulfate permease
MQSTGATAPRAPGLGGQGRAYGWKGFRADLIAGLTVAAVAVPQAMAYALIAGIEPRYGLYTAIIMTALGSLLGSSAHLINGPTNAISLVVLSAVAGLRLANPQDRLQAVFLLSILVGSIQVLIFTLKIGDLTRFVSESVILGFMLGAGFLVALSQLPSLLGLQTVGNGEEHLLYRLGRTLLDGGPIKIHAVAIALGTLLIVVGLRELGNRLRVPLPDMLLALIVMSFVAWHTGWREKWEEFPAGLPPFHVPDIQWGWVRSLSGSALAIALLGLLEAIAIAKSIAARTRQPLDYNWQCLAEGVANIGGGFFQCMPGSGSLTRSAINFQAGAISRLSGLLSAGAVALTVVLFADLARFVPRPALAGILLVTAWRLIDRSRIGYCLRATPFDRNVALATAASAVFISIEFSILIGVFLSFVFFVPRASRLLATELVVSRGRVIRERHAEDPPCNKLVVLSLEGELFFGAAPELDQHLANLEERVENGVRVIVIRVKRARNPDMVCLERLQHFLQDMQHRDVPVLLCGVRQDFADALARLGFQDWLPGDRIFLEASPGSSGDLKKDYEAIIRDPHLSSTLLAIRRAYEVLGADVCSTCPRRQEMEQEKVWYYVI